MNFICNVRVDAAIWNLNVQGFRCHTLEIFSCTKQVVVVLEILPFTALFRYSSRYLPIAANEV